MAQIAGFESCEVEFNRRGEVLKGTQVDALLAAVAPAAVTDLIVFSHGWNNDMAEARKLYEKWLTNARACIGLVPALAQRRIVFCGLLWPSKRFADDELIPGGAASAGGANPASDVVAQIGELKKVYDTKEEREQLTKLEKLVPKLEQDAAAREQFIDGLRKLMADSTTSADDGSDHLMSLPAEEVYEILSDTPGAKRVVADDEGGAAGIGEFFGKVFEGARNALNMTTYYEMKSRAGLVGSTGANSVLQQVRAKRPNLHIHLVGHSFGGRLVTAIADGKDHVSALKFDSMTLLQAAYSHNGLGKRWDGKNDGFFRKVVDDKRVRGPILITHTENDKAVGRAYPLASRLNREAAAGLGDANDRFGGIGRNGAQKTPEANALQLLPVGGKYAFQNGAIHNLEATAFVSSHGDVAGKEVVFATLCAIATA